jgi:hypothetical protein
MTRYNKRIIECVRSDEGQFAKVPVKPAKTLRIEGRLKVAGSTSLGNTTEAANFREVSVPQTVTYFFGQKILDANTEITDAALGIISGGETNFAASSEYVISDLVSQVLRYREGIHYLDGTGIVGVLGGTVTAGTTAMTVSGYDGTLTTRATDRTSVNAMIWPNGQYDIYDSSTFVKHGTVTVLNQNAPTSSNTLGNFTLAAPGFPAGVATSDLLVWKGAWSLAYNGLSVLIDNDVSGTFQGVDFTANPMAKVWQSTVLANGGTPRALTPALIMAAQRGRKDKMSGSPSPGGELEFVGSNSIGEQVYNMFNIGGIAANVTSAGTNVYSSAMRINPSDKEVGSDALTLITPYGKVKFNMKYHCPNSVLFGVDYNQLGFYQSKPLGWRPAVSNMFTPSQANATRTAQMYEIGEVAVEDRRHMFKILDIAYEATNSGA